MEMNTQIESPSCNLILYIFSMFAAYGCSQASVASTEDVMTPNDAKESS